MWKQGPLSMFLNGLNNLFQNQNTERTGNPSGCHPSSGLELWPKHLHITQAQRALDSEHKVNGLAAVLASTCCEAGRAPFLLGPSIFPSVKWGLQHLPQRVTLTIKLIMGVKDSFKLWNTYANAGICRSYNANRGDFYKSLSLATNKAEKIKA